MNHQNKEVVRKLTEELEGNGQLDLAGQLLAADLAGHTPFGELKGRGDFVRMTRMLRAAFPDMTVQLTHLISDGDLVASRINIQATNNGPFQGMPATGRPIQLARAALYRLAGGKVVELWAHPDMLSLMQQLGVEPQPEAAR